MSALNPKHSNRIYWVPLSNNLSCPSGEKNPVCLVSKQPETYFNLLSWYLRLFREPYWHGFWRDHIYRWAFHRQSCETTKWTVFLEIEAAFPYCDWFIKKSRIICFGPTSVHTFKQLADERSFYFLKSLCKS